MFNVYRFSEVSGKLNPDIFLKTYTFLDEYQEDEVNKMSKSVKKVKNAEKLETMSSELQRKKQEMAERRRDVKLREKMRALKAEEKEKVTIGSNIYIYI
jgi:ribosomal RNA-processing protein 36